jgi:double-stranded uracil-DNA glycosylase
VTAGSTKRCLAPLLATSPRILILGSLPGDESLRQQQYYAHKQNQFWRMLAAVYGQALPSAYSERLDIIMRNGLAVWDVLASADRNGSLDTAIRNAKPNRFGPFFDALPALQAIAFNGQKAHALFRQHVARDLGDRLADMRIAVLPSTSPASTRPFDEKVGLWRAFLTA